MKSKTRNPAVSAKLLEATHLTIDANSDDIAADLVYLLDEISRFARLIQLTTENTVALCRQDGNAFEGLGIQEVHDIQRLSHWIEDIAKRAFQEFVERPQRAPEIFKSENHK